MHTYQELFNEAYAADDNFQRALEDQFGPGANRFEINRKQFNLSVKLALTQKKDADKAWIAHQDNSLSVD